MNHEAIAVVGGSPFPFGKALSGGHPVSEQEIRMLTQDQLLMMKARLSPPPIEKSENQLSLRLAQELDYSRRLLEQVEGELRERNCSGPMDRQILGQVQAAEEIIQNVSTIVDAKNRCEAVQRSESPEIRKRLLRKNVDGSDAVCIGLGSAS